MAIPIRGTRRRTLAVMVLLSITLVTLDTRHNPTVDKIRGQARDLFSPVRGIARAVFRPVESTWKGIRDYSRLKRDYEDLQDQIGRQEGNSIAAESQLRQLQDLQAVLGLRPCSAIPAVWAEVVGQPASNYDLAVEINRGARDGLKPGMPVVVSGGLVGRLGRVSDTHAFVRILSDPDVNVAVNVVAPQERVIPTTTTTAPPTTTISPLVSTSFPGEVPAQPLQPINEPSTTTTTAAATATTTIKVNVEMGSLHGTGRGKPLAVEWIRGGEIVKPGDLVMTAGDDKSLFPNCIPVGRIATATPRRGSSLIDVTVEPSADLERLAIVTVLLYDPEARLTSATSTAT